MNTRQFQPGMTVDSRTDLDATPNNAFDAFYADQTPANAVALAYADHAAKRPDCSNEFLNALSIAESRLLAHDDLVDALQIAHGRLLTIENMPPNADQPSHRDVIELVSAALAKVQP